MLSKDPSCFKSLTGIKLSKMAKQHQKGRNIVAALTATLGILCKVIMMMMMIIIIIIIIVIMMAVMAVMGMVAVG